MIVIFLVCLRPLSPKDYSGVYRGKHNIFTLTLTLDEDGKYTFKQYESFTGGITERGKYEVDGKEIRYYDASGRSLKYEGRIDEDSVTLGDLTMSK